VVVPVQHQLVHCTAGHREAKHFGSKTPSWRIRSSAMSSPSVDCHAAKETILNGMTVLFEKNVLPKKVSEVDIDTSEPEIYRLNRLPAPAS
jgi:hypothetical protein